MPCTISKPNRNQDSSRDIDIDPMPLFIPYPSKVRGCKFFAKNEAYIFVDIPKCSPYTHNRFFELPNACWWVIFPPSVLSTLSYESRRNVWTFFQVRLYADSPWGRYIVASFCVQGFKTSSLTSVHFQVQNEKTSRRCWRWPCSTNAVYVQVESWWRYLSLF